jgi:hypothetical protein
MSGDHNQYQKPTSKDNLQVEAMKPFDQFIRDTFKGAKVDLVTVSFLQMGWNAGVEAEREACARLCEEGVDTVHPTVEAHVMKNFGASVHLANAIRARRES